MTLKRKMLVPLEIIQTAKATFAGRGEERIHVVDGAPTAAVFADTELAVLALRQLVDNALKYSDATAQVTCRAEAHENQVVIRVIDQGPGIPERDRDRVFQKFFRRPGVRNRVPGSGMGLHIAREIARIHGGDLWVEPAPEGGSEFCLALPSSVAEQLPSGSGAQV